MTPALRELLVVALFIGPPNLATGRGAYAIRALPELCLGIIFGRLGHLDP